MKLLIDKSFKNIFWVLLILTMPIFYMLESMEFTVIFAYYYSIIIYMIKKAVLKQDIGIDLFYKLSLFNGLWFWFITGVFYIIKLVYLELLTVI